jgi:NAD(P)-dependent dehydrogenase (short-subunit alcohol dehydrogenase family)
VLIRGKSGIVTGAASGMGRAASALFAKEGSRVVCADFDLDGASEVSKSITASGGEALPIRLDLGDKRSCQEVADKSVERFGRIDFLANFGGVWDGRGIAEIEDEHWDRVLNVNLKGSFMISQAVAPVMIAQKYGRIVLIGSIAARVGGAMGGPHYAASKGGVNSLARALARRLGPHQVTVNSVNPGAVETAMTAGWPPETKAKMAAMTPLGRIAQPIDIASAVLFLVSDLSAWITGETLEVNGGEYFG